MQKQLITDQLIEEYYRELDRLFSQPANEYVAIKIRTISKFITRLRSLRQQERQNVKEGYESGYKDSILIDKNESPVSNSPEHYFTQTFEQKGGGNGEGA